MADTAPDSEFDSNPEFLRRALCYLERTISAGDLATLQRELSIEPVKRRTLVELCVSQTELFEEFRQEAACADVKQDAGRSGQGGDPFLILLERAGMALYENLSIL